MMITDGREIGDRGRFGRQPHLRLAYLTNIPSPYRIEMVEAWAKLNPDLYISVFYTDQSDQGRGWTTNPIKGASEKRLPVLLNLGRYGKLNFGLIRMVANAEVVMIGGFEQLSYLVSALLARIMRKPVILLFDGFSPKRFQNESYWIVALKKLTASMCNVFFANGSVGRRYIQECIKPSPSKPTYNQYLSHSESPINEARICVHGKNKNEIRSSLGLPVNRFLLISCGYLIHRKRIDLIIKAISLLPEENRPLLLIVGTGPLHANLEKLASTIKVEVFFTGFKQGVELAQYYFASDALVLASGDDPWGLVVNEAMSAGLPVIVSDACGASLDLVQEGLNGFIFSNGDAAGLAGCLQLLLRSDLAAFGRASREIISSWTPERSAENLALCVSAAISRL